MIHVTVRTPKVLLLLVWPPPLSLATTRGISVDFFSSGYLDVSVPRVPYVNLCIQLTFHGSSPWGFPHSEICGSMLIYSSPQLIAVSHVLRRLPMPRHSPYALVCLNFFKMILLKWIYHFALSIANNFSVVYFTVNFAFCAKCSFFLPTYGKTSYFLVRKEAKNFSHTVAEAIVWIFYFAFLSFFEK